MRYSNKKLFYFIILLGFLTGISETVQSSQPTQPAVIHLDSIQTVSLDTPWRYHPGDNLKWAQPEFDDSHWQLQTPNFDITEIDTFPGIGWFRLHIVVDSSLFHHKIGLQVSQLSGALSVHWNGENVYQWGQPASTIEQEKISRSGPLPLALQISPQDTQVLALRYSNQWAYKRYQQVGVDLTGPQIQISQHRSLLNELSNSVTSTDIWLLLPICSFFIATGTAFLIFFLFNPKKWNAFFFSIFSLCMGGIFLMFSVGFGRPWTYPQISYYFSRAFIYVLPVAFFSLSGMLYFSFYRRIKRMFLFVSLLCLICLGISFVDTNFKISAEFYIVYAAAFGFILIDSLRVIGMAIYHKKQGSWIIGGGAVSFLAFTLLGFVVMIILSLTKGQTEFNINNIFVFLILIGVLLSIPLSMALYIAREFAWTNQQRIKEEQEKKEILANQKEELSRRVDKQTKELQDKNEQLEKHNQEIMSSIEYASRIQSAILPNQDTLNDLFSQYFIFYQPCEAVSGDFYWTAQVNDSIVFTVADCTGHGVPGAFMSMIGNDLLNHIVRENCETNPETILKKLDNGVMRALKQRGQSKEMSDGMDMALCSWHPKKNQLLFSGAHNPLYLIREGELQEYSASRFPVGGYFKDKSFTQQTVNLQKGDMLYLFSDGFPDQFGGPNGKKFMYSQFRELLIDIHNQPVKQQEKTLQQTIEEWMAQNDEEQIDDICILGIRV